MMTITENDEERGNSYIEYRPGNVGIILSIPHGGLKDDSSIPDRTDGYETTNIPQDINVLNQYNVNNNNKCIINDGSNDKLPINDTATSTNITKRCVNNNCLSTGPNFITTAKATQKIVSLPKIAYKVTTSTDGWTIDLGEIMVRTIIDCFGGSLKPYVIICHLKRTKVDMNRDIIEGAQGNPVAVAAYKCYHDCITRAKSSANRGILFDLHGQSHGKNTTELGYLLPRQSLNCRIYESNKSSLRALASENAGVSGRDLIAGARSFGALLEDEGYYAVPSPRQPFPGTDKYYSGGYITRSYGSFNTDSNQESCDDSLFDAIQLETPRESRIEGGEEERSNYGKALSRVIVMFYRKYYYEQLVHSLKRLG